jgi:hypothetical protein
MNWKGLGRKRPWPNFKEISPPFALDKLEKTAKTPVRVAGIRAEILTSQIRSRSIYHLTTSSVLSIEQ